MNKRFLTLLALPCVALTFAAPAMAQPAPDRPMPPHAGPKGPHHHPMHGRMMGQDMFARFDLNHDGRVTKAEFDEVGNHMFAKMDRNHDGAVTRDEMAGSPEGHMGRWKEHCEMPPPPMDGPHAMRAPMPVQDGAPGFAQKRPDDPSYKLWTATPAMGYADRNDDAR